MHFIRWQRDILTVKKLFKYLIACTYFYFNDGFYVNQSDC